MVVSRIVILILGAVGLVVGLLGGHSVAQASGSRVTTVTYRTRYQGKEYRKRAVVYLPAGYDDRQRYNVIYLLHGSTESSQDFFRDGNFHSVLDQLIATKRLRPSIVVFPTYYPSRRFVTNNYYHDRRLNEVFARHELVSDLVPAVEGHYRTYTKETSQQALQASRNHRAFGGFSMGAITTWYVFQYQLPYFATFLPIAGDSWTVEDDGGSMAPRATAKRLAATVDQAGHPAFKILAGVGGADGTSSSMTPQIRAMRKLPEFDRTNLQYYRVPGGAHSPQTVARAFRHFAPSIFH